MDIYQASLTTEQLYAAVREGVTDAIWRMITNATDAPCQDFYQTIHDAAKEAFGDVVLEVHGDHSSDA